MTHKFIETIRRTVPRRTLVWWTATLLTLLTFDMLWAVETSFNHFTYISLYVNMITATFLIGVPSALWRRIWPQAIVLLLYDAVLVANLMYCRTYQLAIPLTGYFMVSNLNDFTGSVTEAMRWRDLLVFVPAVAAIFISVPRREGPTRRFRMVYLTLTLMSSAVSFGLVMACGGFRSRVKMMSDCVNQATCVMPVYTVAGQLLYDLMTLDAPLTRADSAAVDSFIAHAPVSVRLNATPRRNVVMILCESLESWPIGLEIDGEAVTPRLNALVADPTTLYRPAIVTQVGAGRSIDAQLLMLAGLMPPRQGVWSTRYSANTYPSLVKAMRETGGPLTATLMTLDLPTTWNQAVVARNLGFDRLVTRDDWNLSSAGVLNVDGKPLDEVLFRQGAERMDSILGSGRNFVLMVTATGHNPFVLAPGRSPRDYDDEERPEILSRYLEVTAYLDAELGRFVDRLRSRRWWDETTVIITGDHEGLASHRKCLAKEFPWVDAGEHTPLIVLNAPACGGRVDRPAGQVDVYTTLLDLFGASGYGWRGVGTNMLDTLAPRSGARRVSDVILRGDLLK